MASHSRFQYPFTSLHRPTTGGRSRSQSQRNGSSMNVCSVCRISQKLAVRTNQIMSVEFDPGCEAMVFNTNGTPLQGITGGFGGDRRVDHIIPRSALQAGRYEIVIESSCNGM